MLICKTKDDTLPLAARNLPDWTQLLDILVTMVSICKTQELYSYSKVSDDKL